jgi:hypothetical protein
VRKFVLIAALMSTLATSLVFAQGDAPGTVSASASLSGIVQMNTDLDRGGDMHWGGSIASASVGRQWTQQLETDLVLNYSYEEWKFSDRNTAWNGKSPWRNINRPSIGFDLSYAVAADIVLDVVPTFEWAYASGAQVADAQVFGAIVSASKVFSPKRVLGLGASVFREIGKTSAVPFIVIDWQIDDHWRITNPFPEGPAGAGGAELAYSWTPKWEVAGGATYRSYRFRLDQQGPYPDGIGVARYIPVFGRLTYRLDKHSHVDFYGGVLAGGRLQVHDRGDNDISDDRFNAAPVLGLTFATSF